MKAMIVAAAEYVVGASEFVIRIEAIDIDQCADLHSLIDATYKQNVGIVKHLLGGDELSDDEMSGVLKQVAINLHIAFSKVFEYKLRIEVMQVSQWRMGIPPVKPSRSFLVGEL